jgi:hypothetical protein
MSLRGFIFGPGGLRRAVAVIGCAALLYFAAGGTFLHQHSGGPETACPVCQALHMPALVTAALQLIPHAQHLAWCASLPELAAPAEPFSLHRASRAPPQA